jgi:hypothetical protein|nr:MAG TPA: hypothetical protein [Caudoviricetes sp.]
MLSDEEKEKLEQEFQYALDNIVSKIKGETVTAIVVSEQSMILLFTKLMLKIEKQSKEIEELKEKNKTLKSLQNDTNGLYIEMTERKNYFERELQKVEDKIKAKIEEFKIVRDTILENEKEFNRPMMTYDLKRNDYCEKMLQSLLEKE